MTGKVKDILKNSVFVIPRLLLLNYKKLKITDSELILLIYLIDDNEFDPQKISKDLNIKQVDVLNMINDLEKKGIVKLKSKISNNMTDEFVDLDELYNKLVLIIMENKEKKQETTIYDLIQEEFGRGLSSMEYEIIGAWLDQGFSEELIKEALREAVYNGVTNLRYIDRILADWRKKGIKTKDDVKLKNKKKEENKVKEVFDYDWLNE